MAQVNTALWAVGIGLPPGQEHHWFQDGQTYGRVRWFIAYPLALAGVQRSVEIVRVFTLVKADGGRQIRVNVRNVGTEDATYGVFVAEAV